MDLRQVRVGEVTGDVQWEVLELYNNITREVAEQQTVFLIDLAAELPKNSSLYYDYHHFTNAGAKAVAEIVAGDLQSFLQSRFSKDSQLPRATPPAS